MLRPRAARLEVAGLDPAGPDALRDDRRTSPYGASASIVPRTWSGPQTGVSTGVVMPF
jgi:hypothetical protein